MVAAMSKTDVWEQLQVLQDRRQQLTADIKPILETCIKEHNMKSIVDCHSECYVDVLERIRRRYVEASSDQPEWFTGRWFFLRELDGIIADVMDYQLHPRVIEDRIKEEKQKWYVEQIRSSMTRLMGDNPAGRNAVQERLAEEKPWLGPWFDDLVAEVQNALNKNAQPLRQSDLTAFLDRFAIVKDQKVEARAGLYKENFFNPNGLPGFRPEDSLTSPTTPTAPFSPEAALASRQRYLDLLLRCDVTTMAAVVEQILIDSKADSGAQIQRKELMDRLVQLRRARAANELEKAKKEKARRMAEAKRVPDELYRMPACAQCGERVEWTGQGEGRGGFVRCVYCQVLHGNGVGAMTVYCDKNCTEKGLAKHQAAAHQCSSKQDCVQLGQDEDVDMDAEDGVVFCNECLGSHKVPTIYCSSRCAGRDFQRHRETVHLPARERQGWEKHGDIDKLVFEDEAKTQYHAKDMRDLMVPLSAEIMEWEEYYNTKIGIIPML